MAARRMPTSRHSTDAIPRTVVLLCSVQRPREFSVHTNGLADQLLAILTPPQQFGVLEQTQKRTTGCAMVRVGVDERAAYSRVTITVNRRVGVQLYRPGTCEYLNEYSLLITEYLSWA